MLFFEYYLCICENELCSERGTAQRRMWPAEVILLQNAEKNRKRKNSSDHSSEKFVFWALVSGELLLPLFTLLFETWPQLKWISDFVTENEGMYFRSPLNLYELIRVTDTVISAFPSWRWWWVLILLLMWCALFMKLTPIPLRRNVLSIIFIISICCFHKIYCPYVSSYDSPPSGTKPPWSRTLILDSIKILSCSVVLKRLHVVQCHLTTVSTCIQIISTSRISPLW